MGEPLPEASKAQSSTMVNEDKKTDKKSTNQKPTSLLTKIYERLRKLEAANKTPSQLPKKQEKTNISGTSKVQETPSESPQKQAKTNTSGPPEVQEKASDSPQKPDNMNLSEPSEAKKKPSESPKKHEKINIFGHIGVGKTRVAKKVSARAIKENVFDFTIWVFMCREYTKDSLCMSIARQLFLIPANEEWEVDDDNNKVQDQDWDEVPDTDELIKKIKEKLLRKVIKKDGDEVPATLVVLDDVLDGKSTITNQETTFWRVWNEMLPVDDIRFASVLISIKKREGDEEISPENVFEIPALTAEDRDDLFKKNLETTEFPIKKESFRQQFVDKFIGGWTARNVILIAKILNHYCADESRVSFIEKELKEETEIKSLSKFFCSEHMHDVLPIGVLKDLRWKGDHFFRKSGSVHYSELITYWILEGYLGGGSMTKLYQKGHGVLMELIGCGVIKLQEGGYVFMENELIEAHDLYQRVEQNPNLGLATVISSKEEGLGRITHSDGMLKTTPKRPKKKLASEERVQDLPTNETLLLDGTRFTMPEIEGIVKKETNCKAFGLFYLTITELPTDMQKMKWLRVLVLRDCEFLTKAKVSLEALEVLEISGGRNLKRLTSSFFKNLLKLKSLHLSGLQIQSIPQAIYNLENIKWLIVKDCPRLKKLESISKLVNLIVVDLSGNTSLDTLDKNFLKFVKLQSLNLSKTLLSTTPLLKNREELTHLLCRDCSDLGRLRGLTSLKSLQTIDLSGSDKFEEFHDSSLQSLTSLITLKLSETAIDRLPSNISKPHYLYLERCPNLRQLKGVNSFENLEVLQLSGSSNLVEIEDKLFEKMDHLRVLKLSETKISNLPSPLNLPNLREFDLSNCRELETFPWIESAEKLEVLDASNCSNLQVMDSKSFQKMTRLQKIDFSNTKIKSFPSLPNPCNLSRLLLKNCNKLENLVLDGQYLPLEKKDGQFPQLEKKDGRFPNLEELNLSGVKSLKPNGAKFVEEVSSLRILDLSYTSITQLPSLLNLTKLTHLSLAGCKFSSEPKLDYPPSKIEVLDLSRSSIKSLTNLKDHTNLKKLMLKECLTTSFQLPHEISTSTHLEYIEFPNVNVTSTPQEVNDQDCWNICELSQDDKSPVFHNPTQFLKINQLANGSYQLCAVPNKVEGETSSIYPQRHELVFRDVYLQTARFTRYKNKKSLQIRGFSQFPKGIEFKNIIKGIDLVLLIDYKLKGIPSDFDVSMLPNLKGCWIEKCSEMVTVFQEKEPNNDKPKKEPNNDKSEKEPNTNKPEKQPNTDKPEKEPNNDKPEKEPNNDKSEKEPNTNKPEKQPNTDKPEKELNNDKPEKEPNNENPEKEPNSDKPEFNIPLEDLSLRNNKKLKTIYSGKQPFKGFDSLKSLYIDSCRELTSVFSSSCLPKNLEVLEIKYCDKILDFGGELPQSLQALKIWECPKVKQLEAEFKIPEGLKTLSISGANSLKNFVTTNNEPIKLETLKVENCSNLEHIMSSSSILAYINMIDIRSCERMKNLCTDIDSKTTWENLKKLHLEELPVLKQIGAFVPPTVKPSVVECPNVEPIVD
ncbi:putative P-loop containing nucleoside triphosphate hydrolase, leucine-rich repeat domain superfamily [Helianthus annuus]|uniref:P-loop containing nucleoside triphosphate hydrolase, leucine-rich repeat domain superfamily n=1 Tax=Helianthus annuus TaxID=4232 RepID=A0A251VKC4_HELAN|nr:putative disease resistance protein At4g19050 [Helianthus annuus]XP_022041648.1 putative disease resistance protein At4g19050 [Helianthus annuus]KAF5820785.1 putative P-loop containing nucleoside triphosphate hydrolase, leucine-rich repeat domain superfamily [Helianthus annuus]KAJ0610544.1 putative P-loop containing nucleoside triphosphate hydrolase, leucine-rich repeat domain superfamily [Helianthus annuus]KAJ0621273.1 putative P-loop containing nucleoside triphosphate hydrolase, leucine-ri